MNSVSSVAGIWGFGHAAQHEVNRAIKLPDLQERFLRQGAIPAPGTPEEYAAVTRSEIASGRRW